MSVSSNSKVGMADFVNSTATTPNESNSTRCVRQLPTMVMMMKKLSRPYFLCSLNLSYSLVTVSTDSGAGSSAPPLRWFSTSASSANASRRFYRHFKMSNLRPHAREEMSFSQSLCPQSSRRESWKEEPNGSSRRTETVRLNTVAPNEVQVNITKKNYAGHMVSNPLGMDTE